jgi:hypothetical protein
VIYFWINESKITSFGRVSRAILTNQAKNPAETMPKNIRLPFQRDFLWMKILSALTAV